MKAFFFCTFILFMTWSATSAAYDYSLTGGNTATSNDFHVAEIHVRGEKVNGFGLAVGEANGTAQGAAFNLVSVEALAAFQKKTWAFTAGAGMDSRTISAQPSAQYAVGDISVTKTIGKSSSLQLEGGQGYYGQDLQTQYALDEGLRGGYYKLGGTFYLDKRWRTEFFARQMFLNDGNTRSEQDAAIFYGISPDWPWIWVGFGGNNLSDSMTSDGYWTPRQFVTYGPRVDVSFPLGEKFAFATGFSLNKFRDIDAGEGLGYYAVAKFIYEPSAKFRAELGYEGIKSEQFNNTWRSDAAMISLVWKP